MSPVETFQGTKKKCGVVSPFTRLVFSCHFYLFSHRVLPAPASLQNITSGCRADMCSVWDDRFMGYCSCDRSGQGVYLPYCGARVYILRTWRDVWCENQGFTVVCPQRPGAGSAIRGSVPPSRKREKLDSGSTVTEKPRGLEPDSRMSRLEGFSLAFKKKSNLIRGLPNRGLEWRADSILSTLVPTCKFAGLLTTVPCLLFPTIWQSCLPLML